MVKVAILDDESKSIRSLVYELQQFGDRIEIVAQYGQVQEALNLVNETQIDCLFLDVEMPQMDGFRFLEHLKNRDFEVVFVTAYSEYAIQALRNRAFDYLLKPVDGEDLDRVLSELELKIRSKKADLNPERVILNTDKEAHMLDPREIEYCQSEGSYTWVYSKDGTKILVSKNLKYLEKILPDSYFFRIHHSYLINIHWISLFDKSQSQILLDSGASLPLSRLRKKEFIKNLKSILKIY
ncbi:LytR/AlgR family response regulator transcription factor [Algoriphagus yeomjeoni]|uniref:LytR/AlgR family response regulator transcription factor n=1 Tax=Algoriphagus yeomjeoni TaxID=291403 RepID=UPI003CE5023A